MGPKYIHGDINLNCLGGPSVIRKVFVTVRGKSKSEMMCKAFNWLLLALKMEEGLEPKNVGSF